jgi:RNA polymerase sigma factor (sigma-70 family)
MPTDSLSRFVQSLALSLLRKEGAALTDGQLLSRFIDHREDAAFAELVRRHGPMVLGVCQRLLGNVHDAEDAFQATFLVLVRRASSIRCRDAVGSWLHNVAYRTALEAKASIVRRRANEKQVHDMPHPATKPEAAWPELQPLLDQELSRLPARYRVPFVLCDLEGRTRKEVARQLRIPEGTLSSRLATARKRLADRLRRRGVSLSAAAFAAAFSHQVAVAMPTSLVVSTVQAAKLLAAGQGVAGVLSAQVAALTEGVLQAMTTTKLQMAAVLIFAGVAASGVAGLTYTKLAAGQAPQGALEQRPETGEGQAKGPLAQPQQPHPQHTTTQASNLRELAQDDRQAEERREAGRRQLRESLARDVKRLQGTWDVVTTSHNDKVDPKQFNYYRWHFDGQTVKTSWQRKDGEKGPDGRKYHYVVNPTKAIKEITIYGDNVLIQAIYRFEGDALFLCFYGMSELDRPTSFTAEKTAWKGSPHVLWKLRRETGE